MKVGRESNSVSVVTKLKKSIVFSLEYMQKKNTLKTFWNTREI